MVKKYKIVLIQSNNVKKVLATSNVKRNIYSKFNKFLREKKPLFILNYTKRKNTSFELGVISTLPSESDVYKKDELGRNVIVNIDYPNYFLHDLSSYWVEEKVYDHQIKKRIFFNTFITNYTKSKNIKHIFTLNNKLIVQENDKYFLFSLKTTQDSQRFLDCIKKHLYKYGRSDCLLIPDTSTVQRKELYKLLETQGFNKKMLYKHFTY
tara:strand:+ start:768 stop:1394 length:627 start_codon:yes stop_codon:yes gene_type:complete